MQFKGQVNGICVFLPKFKFLIMKDKLKLFLHFELLISKEFEYGRKSNKFSLTSYKIKFYSIERLKFFTLPLAGKVVTTRTDKYRYERRREGGGTIDCP